MSDLKKQTINGLDVHIDRSLCIGSGNCVNLAPDVFTLREDALVDFTDDVNKDADPGQVIEACAVCPVDALMVYDEDGEQIVP